MTDIKDSWPKRALAGEYRASAAATDSGDPEYTVEGILPRTGASVWFGAGSVGKTQLLLWMAAHIAADADSGVGHWLGQPIQRRGQILVVTAEDLRENLVGRLHGIVGQLAEDHDGIDKDGIFERIHLLPFLSLTTDEFHGSNPALFRSSAGDWRPSDTLEKIDRFIVEHNEGAAPNDRIVGVIMDSAVSMAGFDLSNAEATTSFLFHINRTARRHDVFWAIIGHTTKSTRFDPDDPQANAVGRLRGSAMWSTSPRTVIEVRTATTGEDYDRIRAHHPDIEPRDIVYVAVVKANSKGADFRTKRLRRLSEGAFEPLSQSPGPVGVQTVAAVRAIVVDAIRHLTNGGEPGSSFSRDALKAEIECKRDREPALAGFDTSARGAERKPGNLADMLFEWSNAGMITPGRPGPCRIKVAVADW